MQTGVAGERYLSEGSLDLAYFSETVMIYRIN